MVIATAIASRAGSPAGCVETERVVNRFRNGPYRFFYSGRDNRIERLVGDNRHRSMEV
jgi:hypothetical protein